ncbi:putative pre-16S rRNA nuclease [Oryza brachyantha]|uniref:YqgF/RNase H-like domain-containing protein n=1 Tax=Oryza brachyantha TaxID=4533 RepID=J3N4S8_ORYBR|nr:putative pre-16S rRNA nuclease [Oryza brachyantha]
MAAAKPTEPAPLRGSGAAVAASQRAFLLPPQKPRRIRAGAIRASPRSSSSGSPDELPAALLPNARRLRRRDGCGFSLGIDLGEARTGLAVGRGVTLPRPLTVLRLRGQRLELMLLDIAHQQEADELIVGLPVSADGSETPQSNKVRSVVGRLAVQAADRGLRVYLQDEHGTSIDALEFMISRGVKRSARDVKSDAYSAMMILERYFSSSGQGAKIVLPKQPELQGKLIAKSRQDAEF